MKKYLFILLLGPLAFCNVKNLPIVEEMIAEYMHKNNTPAIAVAVIKSGELIHISTDGTRDIEKNLPADLNTPFHIASVSKTVTSLAIFLLVESGKLDLQKDINGYLPFQIINPHHPTDTITIHQLLNHHSGIIDDYHGVYRPFWDKPKGDNAMPLKIFLSEYLVKGGSYYSENNFKKGKNFKKFNYSNTGYALLGLIIEQVSGMSFSEYSKANIFEPLELKNTGWFLRDFNESDVAKTYADEVKFYFFFNGYKFHGHNGYPDYPAGQLRTSIQDYSTLIFGYLNADSQQYILKTETLNKITPIARKKDGISYTWFIESIDGREYYSHDGGDVGASAKVLIDVKNKSALIIFVNSENFPIELHNQIIKTIFKK